MHHYAMSKYPCLIFAALLLTLVIGVQAQSGPEPTGAVAAKTIVITSDPQSNSTIAIPPIREMRFTPGNKGKERGETIDLTSWLNHVTAVNGLESLDAPAWHIVVSYDQYDEDGDNVNSGVYEEFWAGPRKYKRTYKSDTLNQTEYATAKGLFRVGDQKWPDQASLAVRSEIVAPFDGVATMSGAVGRKEERTFGNSKLDCVFLYGNSQMIPSEPPQYCFEPGADVLRYSRGDGWFQTAYNQIAQLQGRSIAHDVVVTTAGKPYLKLHVASLDPITNVNDADFTPPPDALPIGNRISGVRTKAIKSVGPESPQSLRGQHWTAHVQIVIGKDGHVVTAHTIDGPPEAAKACEEAAMKWVFVPYLVLGEPVEVETRIVFTVN